MARQCSLTDLKFERPSVKLRWAAAKTLSAKKVRLFYEPKCAGNRELGMVATADPAPRWSQDQAIAYEAALEAINDVIAGYSEQIAAEQSRPAPDAARVAWLEMRTDQAVTAKDALNVTDTDNVRQALEEFSSIVRSRDS